MVNGTTSKMIYLGAWSLVCLVVLCITYLSVTETPTPEELKYVLIACVGVLAGVHVKAPTGDPVKELTSGKNPEGGGRNDAS